MNSRIFLLNEDMVEADHEVEEEAKLPELKFCECCQVATITSPAQICSTCVAEPNTLKAFVERLNFERDEDEDPDDAEERLLDAFLPSFYTIVTLSMDEEHPYYCGTCEKETHFLYSYPTGVEGGPKTYTGYYCCLDHCAVDAFNRCPE